MLAGADIPFPRMVDAWLLAVAIGRGDQSFTRVGTGGVELKAVTALNVLNNNPAAVALGRLGGAKGGKARAAALTPAQRSEIAKKAAAKRWGTEP